jgi:hypothetical protein
MDKGKSLGIYQLNDLIYIVPSINLAGGAFIDQEPIVVVSPGDAERLGIACLAAFSFCEDMSVMPKSSSWTVHKAAGCKTQRSFYVRARYCRIVRRGRRWTVTPFQGESIRGKYSFTGVEGRAFTEEFDETFERIGDIAMRGLFLAKSIQQQ